MESITEKFMYDKVADNIRDNIESINRLLSICTLHSKGQESQIVDFFSLDINNLIDEKSKAEYYDIDKVTKIFDLLGSTKSENKKRNKFLGSEFGSSSSLTTSCLSIDNATSSEHKNEMKSHLTEIRVAVESISNGFIKSPDLRCIENRETAKNTAIVDLSVKLQKLSKELQNIASTDNIFENQESLDIDDKFIIKLNQLSEVSD